MHFSELYLRGCLILLIHNKIIKLGECSKINGELRGFIPLKKKRTYKARDIFRV